MPRVLRFTGAPDACHGFHGLFWPRGCTLGLMSWDAWVKPRGDGYLISDGWGGAHALLWGFTDGFQHGNIWNGSAPTSFSGTYQANMDEWVHAQVAWNGQYIYSYINGVCDGKTPFTGPRRAGTQPQDGYLYVGGSDHQNGKFDLACVRGWDRLTALNYVPERGQMPERLPLRWSVTGIAETEVPCDFYCDYTTGSPCSLIDSSPCGCSATADPTMRHRHHGRLFPTGGPDNTWNVLPHLPLPQWIDDPDCPFGQNFGQVPNENVPLPETPPPGALAFDSFGRANETYTFQPKPALGNAETGQPWSAGAAINGAQLRPVWGILQGAAVYLGDCPSVAWVPTSTPNQDVRITRDLHSLLNKETGLAFRVVDARSHWKLTFDPANHCRLGFWANGVYTTVANIAHFPNLDNFTILRATVDSGHAIRCYVDDSAGGWIQIGSAVTDNTFSCGTGAGIATSDVSAAQNSLARYKRFTVLGI